MIEAMSFDTARVIADLAPIIPRPGGALGVSAPAASG